MSFWKIAATVLLVLPLAVAPGCEDTPGDSTETAMCSDSADPIFLRSKTDDDDGDGIILDEDFPAINDEDDDIADHAWVRDNIGIYHLFFQNEGLGSGSDIEHYTSINLRSLNYVGVALARNPGAWDADNLWAPDIVRNGGTYYMFYTGVEGSGPTDRQRIGIATSTDLMNWTRLGVNNCPGTSGDGCVYECDEGWTTWGDPVGSFNQQCRDPFVIRDADNQRWVLFVTAKSTNQFGVVTVAYSENLIDWEGAGYINATRRLPSGLGGQMTGGQAENPFVMSNGGTHYLLFTDWQDPEDSLDVANPRTITQYATSATLVADTSGSSNWTYRGYIPDPGVNANEIQKIHNSLWIMSQSISNERSGNLEEHRRELRLKCVIWGGDFDFDTSNFSFSSPGASAGASPLTIENADRK